MNPDNQQSNKFSGPYQGMAQNPYQAPAQSMYQGPAPNQGIAGAPAQPVQNPYQTPAQNPYQQPAQSMYQAPVQNPYQGPAPNQGIAGRPQVPAQGQNPGPVPGRIEVRKPEKKKLSILSPGVVLSIVGNIAVLVAIFLPFAGLLVDGEERIGKLSSIVDMYVVIGLVVVGIVFSILRLGIVNLLVSIGTIAVTVFEIYSVVSKELDLKLAAYIMGAGAVVYLIGAIVLLIQKTLIKKMKY